MDPIILLVVFLGLLPVILGIGFLLERAKARQIANDRRRPRVVVPLTDLALIFSPAVVEVLLLLLSISDSFTDGLAEWGNWFLDLLCATPLPMLLCNIKRPTGVAWGLLLAGHLTFLIASAWLFARIVLGAYPKPINYDARPVRLRGAIICASLWLLAFLGGSFFIGRASFFGPLIGTVCAAMFCWWLKFGRSEKAAR